MSRPFKLYRLQQLDSQIEWMESRLNEIDAILKKNEELRQAEQEMNLANENQDRASRELRKAEENVQSQRLKIEQSEASLYGGLVRNPKELQDLQNEVAALKRYLEVLEDRQLEAMLVDEEAASEKRLASQRLDDALEASSKQHAVLTKEQEKLFSDLENHVLERQAAARSIESADLRLYAQLRLRRGGIAVSKVTDRACSACGSTLNTALLHAARSPNYINRCDTCGRILYAG
jgi:predicted  nucleic acid-binding Zn-ribbon protein